MPLQKANTLTGGKGPEFYAATSFSCLLLSLTLCIWMSTHDAQGQLERLSNLEAEILCAECEHCLLHNNNAERQCCSNVRSNCKMHGLQNVIPKKCTKTHSPCRKYIEMKSEEGLKKQIKDITVTDGDKREYLHRAVTTAYKGKRFLVHWFLRNITDEGNGKKKRINNYNTHKSDYTVSPGLRNTNDGGCLVIPINGLYMLYVKLGFFCKEADGKSKRISVEVVVDEGKYQRTLMQDYSERVCNIEGDLTTMYQSGLFRLAASNRINIYYRASKGVTLTNDRRHMFKSNIGAMWMGLS